MLEISKLPSKFRKSYQNYRELLDDQNLLDFSEMVYRTVNTLKENEKFY